MSPARSDTCALAVACALAAAGCYHAQPLDERALIAQAEYQPMPASAPSQIPRGAVQAPGGAVQAPGGAVQAPGGAVQAPAGAAQAPAGAVRLPGGGLSADQAVALALVSNPELRAERHRLGLTEGEMASASALSNPSVRLEALHLQRLGDDGVGYGVALEWEPPQPGVRPAAKARARARAARVEQEVLELEQETIAAVRLAHATVAWHEEEIAVLAAAVTVRRQLVASLEGRMATGHATRVELDLARVALAETERERDDLIERRAVALEELMGQMGVVFDGPVAIAVDPAAAAALASTVPPEPGKLMEQALASRPGFKAAHARYDEEEQEVRLERARQWPWIKLAASPRYRYNDSSKYPNDLIFGVEVTVPVFDRNRGPILEAEAQRDEARARFTALVGTVRRDIRRARAQVLRRQAAVRRYHQVVLPTLADQERGIEVALASGAVDLKAISSSAAAALKVRLAVAEAKFELREAWIELDRAVGRPGSPK